jgi:hypothetical protein
LVKLKTNTIISGIKKNRIIKKSEGARNRYGAPPLHNREKLQFFAFKEMEGEESSLPPICSPLFIG